jgi:phosphoglycolate phosphatase
VTRFASLAGPPEAVFFDLDGTLADTAADLAAPVNQMRAERGLAPLPLEALRLDFLARYETAMVVSTRLFDGMHEVLESLESAGIRWGVVSNKVERYVRPILDQLGLLQRSVTAVGGDSTAYSKPHPEPLLHAARLAGVRPGRSIYVGDDLRDIEAGRAAGMLTVAAAYGFCGDALPPSDWGADAVIGQPIELAALLRL